MAKVEIYTTTYCGFCLRAKSFFDAKGVSYDEIDVTGDDARRAELIEKTNGRRTVPQIFINGAPVGGYTDLVELDRKGELASLLAQ